MNKLHSVSCDGNKKCRKIFSTPAYLVTKLISIYSNMYEQKINLNLRVQIYCSEKVSHGAPLLLTMQTNNRIIDLSLLPGY